MRSYVFDQNDFSRVCGQIWARGGFVENKVKTAAKQNIQKPTPNAGQHYLHETTANRQVQNHHITRTKDKITLSHRESGNPSFLKKKLGFWVVLILAEVFLSFQYQKVGGLNRV